MMRIEKLELGAMQVNCYILYEENDDRALVVDPGDYGKKIYEWFQNHGKRCEAILLTHGHFDHIMGVRELKELTGAPVYAGENEAVLLADSDMNVSRRIRRPETVVPDVLLKDASQLQLGGIDFKCIFTPGHTAGSVCYYFEKDSVLLSGDTLFKSGFGRTDLPTGDTGTLFNSIRNILFMLPGDTVCYPGHGEATTIGDEISILGN